MAESGKSKKSLTSPDPEFRVLWLLVDGGQKKPGAVATESGWIAAGICPAGLQIQGGQQEYPVSGSVLLSSGRSVDVGADTCGSGATSSNLVSEVTGLLR